MEFMAENQYTPRIKKLGIPDRFIEHGSPEELQRYCGFDAEGIYQAIQAMVKPKVLSNAG
jgi:1-deoxy-D-xylulose-5-phosphate synthase